MPGVLTKEQRVAYHAVAGQHHGTTCLCGECMRRWEALELTAHVREVKRGVDEVNARLDELAAMPYAEYLWTDEWRDMREDAFVIHGRRCQLCNSTERLNVHHRRYTRRGCENPRHDLTVLCRDCHATFHEHRELAT